MCNNLLLPNPNHVHYSTPKLWVKWPCLDQFFHFYRIVMFIQTFIIISLNTKHSNETVLNSVALVSSFWRSFSCLHEIPEKEKSKFILLRQCCSRFECEWKVTLQIILRLRWKIESICRNVSNGYMEWCKVLKCLCQLSRFML